MDTLLRLFLPVIFPSWRFFDEIGASPRVCFRVGSDWVEVTARPVDLTLGQRLVRLVWNPDWNEQLFLVSQSERMILDPDARIEAEIVRRVALRHHLRAPFYLRLTLVDGTGPRVVHESGPHEP